jgi:hypothetical protein
VVAPEPRTHEARNEAVVGDASIVVNALDEGGGAVPNSDDGDPYRFHEFLLTSP